jgi:hypothetical protein
VIVREGDHGNIRSLAEAASIPMDRPIVSIRNDQVVRVNLTEHFGKSVDGGVRLVISAAGLGLAPAEVWIARPSDVPSRSFQADGWGAQLDTMKEALVLSSALLACGGKVSGYEISIPGAEVSPGVWVARGARIDRDVQLNGPAYIGEGAWVQSGATVGPHCHLGKQIVVPSGIELSNQVVPDRGFIDVHGTVSRASDVNTSTARVLILGIGLLLASPVWAASSAMRRRLRSHAQG